MQTQAAELPPADLRVRVSGTDDADWFRESGLRSVNDLRRGLAAAGRQLDEFGTILEWGCGCGRILLPMREIGLPGALHGCDIDADAVAWLTTHAPDVKTIRNEGLPPLPYADDSFDLVYNHSVLSHLDERYQDAWLAELCRITRPDGIVTLSIHGPGAFRYRMAVTGEARDEAVGHIATMERDGIVFIRDPETPDNPFPDYYHQTYHDVGYVFDHWRRWFDILAYLPDGALGFQDLVVLRPFKGTRDTDRTKAAAWPAPPAPPPPPSFFVRARRKLRRMLDKVRG